jgi:hypothetical protein
MRDEGGGNARLPIREGEGGADPAAIPASSSEQGRYRCVCETLLVLDRQEKTVMKKSLTIAAVAALALGAAACHKSEPVDTTNVSAEDNMLVPADENAMMGNDMAMDNSATADNSTIAGNNAM